MTNPNVNALDVKDTLLHQSWQSEAWMPILNRSNVLEYFSESMFYDHQCNNAIIRMQGLNPDQMLGMQGVEYVLLIAQEPILYVIRKQHRTSPTQVCCRSKVNPLKTRHRPIARIDKLLGE